jgi:hypothetical protein
MLAYIFWHVPLKTIDRAEYEAALVRFHSHMGAAPPPGFQGSATYRISGVPWLDEGRGGYEDWCLVTSSAALDGLNKAAVKPERWDVHADIARKTDHGYGALFYHLHGSETSLDGSRVAWLQRPRGIRFEGPLEEIIATTTGFLGVWRKLMVLGPGDEFLIVGDRSLNVRAPDGWHVRTVGRDLLSPQEK